MLAIASRLTYIFCAQAELIQAVRKLTAVHGSQSFFTVYMRTGHDTYPWSIPTS
jgi:hypothetical protein